MARVTVSIPHIAWRDGRPRFQPGPKLRALGFRGENLRHPPAAPSARAREGAAPGAWFTLEETLAWAAAKQAAIDAARSARRRPPAAAAGRARPGVLYTVEDLFEDWFRSPRFAPGDTVEARRRQRPLAPATIRDYRKKAAALAGYDPDLWGASVDALDQPILYGLYEALWADKGLAMARGILAVLSAALSWGMRRGRVRAHAVNPALRLGMETPAPRVRAGEPGEMKALIDAADAVGRPEIGDAIMLGLWTGQRQNDRLALLDDGLRYGRRIFRQAKTGAVVAIRQAPELEARLAAARARRKGLGLVDPHVVVDEQARRPWKADHYRHVFAAVRAAAIAGGPARPPCPTLAGFQERDLRDTAVTWLALAGATVPEICAVTGHAHQSAHAILKHYLARHPELADAAIGKMMAWHNAGTG